MDNGTKKKIVLLAVFLVLLAGLGAWITKFGNGTEGPGGLTPKAQPAPQLDTAKLAAQWPQIVAHAAAPPRGRAKTRYTLAEFGDFQCPPCGKARPVLESLVKDYPAEVNLIFIHRPIPIVHQWAISAAQASEMAAAKGKFWPMYDVLYGHQDDLETGFYGDYAAQAGLNKADFQKAFDAGQGLSRVKIASAFSDSLGVQQTPTVLLHDNVTGAVQIYVGPAGTKQADGSPQYPGMKDLFAHPPWRE